MGDGGAPHPPELPLRPQAQARAGWCWAATASMVLPCLGRGRPTQREVAERWLGRPCGPNDPGVATPMEWLEDVGRLYGLWGVEARLRGREAAGPPVVKAELRAGRPVLVGFDRGGFHLAVAYGWWLDPEGVPCVALADPDPGGPLRRVRSAGTLADPGERTWRWTWTFR